MYSGKTQRDVFKQIKRDRGEVVLIRCVRTGTLYSSTKKPKSAFRSGGTQNPGSLYEQAQMARLAEIEKDMTLGKHPSQLFSYAEPPPPYTYGYGM